MSGAVLKPLGRQGCPCIPQPLSSLGSALSRGPGLSNGLVWRSWLAVRGLLCELLGTYVSKLFSRKRKDLG